MRAIQVSTETFSAIWADRRPGEETEDAIIARRFEVAPQKALASTLTASAGGYVDGRSGVRFNEGFEIFRNYKNKDYKARVQGGQWLLHSTGQLYGSLNALSNAIGASENSWNGWWYRDERGVARPINSLRDQGRISTRGKRPVARLEDL